MANRAIIIGIDDYHDRQLQSAVNDALAVSNALVAHGIVAENEVKLLTSPGTGATKHDIKDAIKEVYRSGDALERFVFFFAGHGMLLHSDPGRTMFRTVLLPSDIQSLDSDGDLLISFNEIFDLLQLVGPKEQLFILDACRDLFEDQAPPVVGVLGLSGVPPGPQRKQAAIFAVSPLGQARAVPAGLGVMTGHLLAALGGDGVATDYDHELDAFVVTVQSAHAYVRAKIHDELKDVPQWRKRYMEPQIEPRGGALSALRVLSNVAPVPFTIHIDPDDAAPETKIELSIGRLPITAHCLPPRQNHEALVLPPQRYQVKVQAAPGTADPVRQMVDVRTTSEIRIKVGRGGNKVVPPQLIQVTGPGQLIAEAYAQDAKTVIRVAGMEPPYLIKEGRGRLVEALAPGPYRITFRLGTDVFSIRDVFLTGGETLTVVPTATVSPLGQDLLGPEATTPTAMPSESIGPMQGALLSTLLPLIGLRQFDRDVLRRFHDLVPAVDAAALQWRPVTVVVALEGTWADPVESLSRFDVSWSASFVVDVYMGPAGNLHIAAASLPGRATIICLAIQPDGRFTLSQNLLALPHLPGNPSPKSDDFQRSPGRVVRDLQIGQQLYMSGELVDAASSDYMIMSLLYAKWTDPILGCMGWHAARRAPDRFSLDHVADNLRHYFGGVSDVHVIEALQRGLPVAALPGPPLLAETLRALVKERPGDPEWEQLLRRIDPQQPWTCTWT